VQAQTQGQVQAQALHIHNAVLAALAATAAEVPRNTSASRRSLKRRRSSS
jgi:hypothetical protein